MTTRRGNKSAMIYRGFVHHGMGLILTLLFAAVPAFAQVPVNLPPVIRYQFFSEGNPSVALAGGKVCTYNAGTTTPAATYVDSGGVIQNTNPIILDTAGMATIWLSQQGYKFVVYDDSGNNSCPNSGVQQWSVDNISAAQFSGANTWTALQTFSGGISTTLPMTLTQGGFSNTLTAGVTGARTWTFPDASGTLVLNSAAYTWPLLQIFSSGIGTDTITGQGGTNFNITAATNNVVGENLNLTAGGGGVGFAGGTVTIIAGNGGGTGLGGAVVIQGGSGKPITGSGAGGTASLQGGTGGALGGNGGAGSVAGGNGSAAGTAGGNVNISPGQGTGGGANGTTVISNGLSPSLGTGYQATRSVAGCATAASLAAVCTTVVAWPSAFADANYTPHCDGLLITSGVPLNGGITAKVAASVTFQTVSGTAAAAQFTNIVCSAFHD